MYTVLKSTAFTVSKTKEEFQPIQKLAGSHPTRFDQIERTMKDLSRKTNTEHKRNRRTVSQYVDPNYVMPHFDPLINAKEFKQAFLMGDKEVIYYLKNPDTSYTTNRNQYRGLQVSEDNRASIIQHFRTTCAGNALPDPALYSKRFS